MTAAIQLRLFPPGLPDASMHGWTVLCEEPQNGEPGYRLAHRNGRDTAWLSQAEYPQVVRDWDRLYRRDDAAPEELDDDR